MNYKEVQWDTIEGYAMHAIGLGGRHKPYARHGRLFYRPWRNRYSTSDRGKAYELWNALEAKGYAESRPYENSVYPGYTFWLTRAGLDWLGETLGITIYDEED